MTCEHGQFWVYMPGMAGCRCGSCYDEDPKTWELWCDDEDDCEFKVDSGHPAFRELLNSDKVRY